MKKKEIKVPVEVNYITDWADFGEQIPNGKVILDKAICGCGCTEFFLSIEQPMILVSPRRELINCKMRSSISRPYPLHYFDRSKKKKVDRTIQELDNYIVKIREHSKILVTYDSLKIVLDFLENKGILGNFNIVVDEFTCIFTDVKLKGNVEINLIHKLQKLSNNVVYISATPINDIYLNELEDFKNTIYMELQWDPSRTEKVMIDRHSMISTQSAVKRIIEKYRKQGYFQTMGIGTEIVVSKEMVFFLNNVSSIVNIIKSCGLTPENTLVVCAENDKNITKLGKVGFTIGHVPNKKEYKTQNKTFTFVTKASFEGVDFYSDNSSVSIFADATLENLALDISIDVPQIIGRCRCSNNPFRHIVSYYYKTSGIDEMGKDKAVELVKERQFKTERQLEELRTVSNNDILKKMGVAQEKFKYQKDYVDIIEIGDKTYKPVFNKLALLADLRAIDIKENQYKTTYTVIAQIKNQGYSSYNSDYMSFPLEQFMIEFNKDSLFTRKMKLYCDAIDAIPGLKEQLEQISDIPFDFKNYYTILGPITIKSLKYRQSSLEQEVYNRIKKNEIDTLIRNKFQWSSFYSKKEVKKMLQDIYDKLGIRQSAKAKDLERYILGLKETVCKVDGKRTHGYKWENMKVSYFKNVFGDRYNVDNNNVDNNTVEIEQVFNCIRTGGYNEEIKKKIEKIRATPNDKERRMLKKDLPIIMWQGIFTNKNDAGLQALSSLVCIDIDHKSGTVLQQLWSGLINEPWVLAMFRSPSGDGLKVIVKTNNYDSDNYKNCYRQIEQLFLEKYNIQPDTNCEALSQCCFLSYDPYIFVNENVSDYQYTYNPAFDCNNPKPIQSQSLSTKPCTSNPHTGTEFMQCLNMMTHFNASTDDKIIVAYLDHKYKKFPDNYKDGNRTKAIFCQAREFCLCGISKDITMEYLKDNFLPTGYDEKKLTNEVESAYNKNESLFGSERSSYNKSK